MAAQAETRVGLKARKRELRVLQELKLLRQLRHLHLQLPVHLHLLPHLIFSFSIAFHKGLMSSRAVQPFLKLGGMRGRIYGT